MTTSIYCSYKLLPASILAQEQFAKAVETFELTVQAIVTNLKKAEEEFVKERETRRKTAIWEYYMTEPIINKHGKHYLVHRKAINPQEGDNEFYKDISYCSFKTVNNVLIITGGGHVFQQVNTGDILTDSEISDLDNLVVPERFKNKPKFTEEGNYYSGS